MTYNLMESIITTAKKNGTLADKRDDTMKKLDAFLAADRLTVDEYQKLVGMMEEGGKDD